MCNKSSHPGPNKCVQQHHHHQHFIVKPFPSAQKPGITAAAAARKKYNSALSTLCFVFFVPFSLPVLFLPIFSTTKATTKADGHTTRFNGVIHTWYQLRVDCTRVNKYKKSSSPPTKCLLPVTPFFVPCFLFFFKF